MNTGLLRPAVATALTVYGIETKGRRTPTPDELVATALTVYGIETIMYDKIKVLLNRLSCNGTYRLRY